MTTSCVTQQGTCGNCATAGLNESKRREKKASEEAAGNVEREMHTHKSRYLKYRTMTGRGRELADMMG